MSFRRRLAVTDLPDFKLHRFIAVQGVHEKFFESASKQGWNVLDSKLFPIYYSPQKAIYSELLDIGGKILLENPDLTGIIFSFSGEVCSVGINDGGEVKWR